MKSSPSKTVDFTHPDVPNAFLDPMCDSGHPIKMAPPDTTARILNAMGYPVNAKLLRRWAKEKKIPSCWTGRRLLLKVAAIIEFMESGSEMPESTDYDD